MFRLIESRPQHARSRGAATISVLAHTAIIVAAVVQTATGAQRVDPEIPGPPPIYIRQPIATPGPAAPATGDPSRPSVPVAPVLPPIDVPIGIPPVGDPVTLPTDPGPYAPTLGLPGAPSGGGSVVSDSTALGADAVDRPVTPTGTARTPRYPELLRRERREGSVVAYFVVDTAGRVEPGSFRTATTTHSLFSVAVETAVLAQRFTPAEVRGKRVRQLVQQRFVFELHR